MSYLPCENPACKSYGHPHPNCRCHGNMAEGGDVSFCSRQRMHQDGCEYFADGGKATALAMADEPQKPLMFDDLPSDGGDKSTMMFDDLKADAPQKPLMFDDLKDESATDYSSPLQQAATVAEGVAHGLVGPVAPIVEMAMSSMGVPGMTPEDQAARQAANPVEFNVAKYGALAASMMTGVGEAGALADVAMQMTGSKVLQAAITGGLLQGGDQISKALLGQGDPEDAVSPFLAVGTAALLGGVGGFIGNAGSKGLKLLADSRLGGEAAETLAGYGQAASGIPLAKGASEALKKGFDAYEAHVQTASNIIIGSAAAMAEKTGLGNAGAVTVYGVGKRLLGPSLEKAIKKGGEYALPTAINWLSKGADGSLSTLLDYAGHIGNGSSMIGKGLDAVFSSGSQALSSKVSTHAKQDLEDWLDGGGITQNIQQQIYDEQEQPQGFAEGGKVKAKNKAPKDAKPVLQNNPIETVLPAQNMLIQAARGRVSNYLSSMRPQKNAPKLAFDDEPDNREAKKNYQRALEIAVSPLSVLEHVRKGTAEPDHIKHLNSLYPELANHLQKKITERITQDQFDGKKPPYKVRQGLSLLMGTALSSELTPQGIMAAQSVFAPKQMPGQQPAPAKSKKSSSSLTKSDRSFLTDDQAREKRQQAN